ncbi:hypothetical protein RFI_06967 [Reticulomyxa filosa]|uniref:Uncharacterized protein n=1 Tax=Reticulomyxa filosa TaxID=46433 RepID=X6NXZ3_RETFI|nr:hypothetical protein RFI_06967 [Reticulomyxa filosa]|eukprot:ETO30152.1 hypothetical protein RFI_06967 [Reticulomyxa filosa]
MNNTYAIVIDGFGNVSERLLGYHNPGTLLTSTTQILSDMPVDSQTRQMTLSRAMDAHYPYYDFSSNFHTIPIIFAYGTSPQFPSIHQMESIGILNLTKYSSSGNGTTTTTTTTTSVQDFTTTSMESISSKITADDTLLILALVCAGVVILLLIRITLVSPSHHLHSNEHEHLLTTEAMEE